MSDQAGVETLRERVRREERASWGMDPDGTAYLDATDRLEAIRAAYRAQLALDGPDAAGDRLPADGDRTMSLVGAAEML